jgi:hypothetical protein
MFIQFSRRITLLTYNALAMSRNQRDIEEAVEFLGGIFNARSDN